MKRICQILLLLGIVLTSWAQGNNALEQLKSDPRKAYGTDYPYSYDNVALTKAPNGYKAFYISHYGRHGSRYYWNDVLYREIDSVLTKAHNLGQLTPVGERFLEKYNACKAELALGVSELSDLGWEQHQYIARTMYNSFPEIFKKGGDVYAISSLVGRCAGSEKQSREHGNNRPCSSAGHSPGQCYGQYLLSPVIDNSGSSCATHCTSKAY